MEFLKSDHHCHTRSLNYFDVTFVSNLIFALD